MDRAKRQALKEKELAEQMVICNDFASARKHLLQAYQLFPAIDNVRSMLTLCDILTASKVKLPGCVIDPYRVLQVMPSSTSSNIGRQYVKLVSALQPIRKKIPCTELALKLILDAFIVLGDHKKRSEFDLKRTACWENYKSVDLQASINQCSLTRENISTPQSSSAYKDHSNQVCDGGSISAEMLPKDVATFEASQENLKGMHKQRMEISVEELIQSPANLKSGCDTRAEVDNYGAKVILPTIFRTGSLEENLCPSKATQQERPFQNLYSFENERKFQLYEAGQIWAINYRAKMHHNFKYARIESTSKAATCVSWLKPIPVTSSERKWCDAGLPVACGSFEVNSDMQMCIESRWPMIASHKCDWFHGMTEEEFEIYPKRGEIWAVYKDWDLDEWSHYPDYVIECKLELVEIISDFSKYLGTHAACLVKLNGFTSIVERQIIGGNPVTFHISPNNLYIFSHRILAHKIQGIEGMFGFDQLALPDYMIQDASTQKTQSKSQKDFVADQVWAVYWGNDFMPRKYVKINNVVSEDKVSVTFLEPLPVLYHEIEWIRQDLPMVCGTFIVGERNANIEISLFSHLVKCVQDPSKSCYKIYPLKGEIWAMYESWNAKWKMASFENYKCQIVHILSDFSEGDEITISELGAVKGCLTFFCEQQYDGFDVIHGVSRADILRFSHRIPAFKVPGIGKYDIPEDAWHLEPLALPTKFSN